MGKKRGRSDFEGWRAWLLVPDELQRLWQPALTCWSSGIFPASRPSLGFAENSPRKGKYQQNSLCAEENALLMLGVRGQNGQTGWRPLRGNKNSNGHRLQLRSAEQHLNCVNYFDWGQMKYFHNRNQFVKIIYMTCSLLVYFIYHVYGIMLIVPKGWQKNTSLFSLAALSYDNMQYKVQYKASNVSLHPRSVLLHYAQHLWQTWGQTTPIP